MIHAIGEEIRSRSDYLVSPIETIYFGGGTPSLMTTEQIQFLLENIFDQFEVMEGAEITLEANPEDLTKDKVQQLKAIGINRLSIGVQTFQNEQLRWMNRAHSPEQIYHAYTNARSAGFTNISLDLMYALPTVDKLIWMNDLEEVVKLDPEHVSLYGLTIEEKTVFGNWEANGKLIQLPEDAAAEQYLDAIEFLTLNGFEQYEVSNFGKRGFSSRHNAAYWSGASYLGVGPGAHSFNGSSRQFNVRNNHKYLRLLHEKEPHFEIETLSATQRLNERILTGLRTRKGINLDQFQQEFGVDLMEQYGEFIQQMMSDKLIIINDQSMSLTSNGFLVADEIALRMFFNE